MQKTAVIAVIAQKGGVGKTTATVSLATAAAMAGMTTLVIDVDPQASACKWSDRRKQWPYFRGGDFKNLHSMALALQKPEDPLTEYLASHLAPETKALINQYDQSEAPSQALRQAILAELNTAMEDPALYDEKRCAHVKMRKETKDLLKKNPEGEGRVLFNGFLLEDAYPQEFAKRRKVLPDVHVIDAQSARLSKTIEKATEQGFDCIIIDTPPHNAQAALDAAKVADLVMIPTKPQIMDLETIPNTKELLAHAGNPPVFALLTSVPTQGDRHDQAAGFLSARSIAIPVCETTIGHRAAFGDSAAMGLTPLDLDLALHQKAAEEILNVFKYTIQTLKTIKAEGASHEHQTKSRRTG